LETDDGDYLLFATIQHHETAVPLEPITFSRVANLDSRLLALALPPGDATSPLDETCSATIRSSLKLLKSLQAGNVPECNLPASRILRFCEQLGEATIDPHAIVAASAAVSDLWMTLSKDGKEVAVRLRAPAADSRPAKLPVLFLFHGAGGSENMFFENYGAGRAVQLALERGWLVVAPRQGFLGLPLTHVEQLEVLEHFFSIDRQRVFLLGHSMGAAQVVRQVSSNPCRECVRAAAAVGGGGQPSKATGMELVPWFIAAGKQDFGRPMASALAARLKSLGAEVTYREYDDVEHLVIVQASLDDVFRFFDQAAAIK
jgi:predicted esterase